MSCVRLTSPSILYGFPQFIENHIYIKAELTFFRFNFWGIIHQYTRTLPWWVFLFYVKNAMMYSNLKKNLGTLPSHIVCTQDSELLRNFWLDPLLYRKSMCVIIWVKLLLNLQAIFLQSLKYWYMWQK